ncbi:HupE/UreJ family protein [Acidimangrovimonas sediminis]|nr:HupE/UreJ family protein [Acidimangrovimonas sediminis]
MKTPAYFALFVTIAAPAKAHSGPGPAPGFGAGVGHPLTGPDHPSGR